MSRTPELVVIGNGMAGARFVEEIVARGGSRDSGITIFGEEPGGNYNRILLSSVLAGAHQPRDIVINPVEWYAASGVTLRAGVEVASIDTTKQRVYATGGHDQSDAYPYDTLVIATGSRPLIPPIEGVFAPTSDASHAATRPVLRSGVFAFRTLDDCSRIMTEARHARSAVVIGGGLLGLEAAKGLLSFGIEVHVLHLTASVMDTQLDAEGSRILQRQLRQLGMQVHTSAVTAAIVGDARVEGVRLRDGSTIACDMVVVAAGIRPDTDLARRAGLAVARGIVVDDHLACAGASNVYAIGECAEHRGQLYGLVAPLWEQARVLADRLTARRPEASYTGSRVSTTLKVAGIDLAVMGLKEPVDEDDEVVTYSEPSRGIYKKLIVRGQTLVGAILIGDPAVVPSLGQAFSEGTCLGDHRPDLLFPPAVDHVLRPAADLPDTAQICDCNAVTKAQIIEAVLRGSRSVHAVCEKTRASTGCGSCRPEVERIVEMACLGLAEPSLLAKGATAGPADETMRRGAGRRPAGGQLVVTLNKIERLKQEKDPLEIVHEVPALAAGGWEAIVDNDRERLKWAGVFFRRQTPGQFMMRVRISNGLSVAEQVETLAGISEEFGTGSLDITTRQQVQLRGFGIEQVEEIWRRLERVDLVTLQTGMDNIRNVIGCSAAGLTPREIVDASPIVKEFTEIFLRNRAFTNLPRKFNVGISGCTEHCTHAESQDLALTPAVGPGKTPGFNVAVGGKMGSGGCRMASPLDVFVEPQDAAALSAEMVLLFRDHGPRGARNKARLAFLVDDWGVDRVRQELETRIGRSLPRAGRDARVARGTDHLGIEKQKQPGLSYVGLAVPVGRIAAADFREVARVAVAYGNGEVRFTTGQNIILPNVPDASLGTLVDEPLLQRLPHDPPGAIRGLVACTGIDYCHFALIETKELALRTARDLAERLPPALRMTTHWSGCPAGCGNHAAADVGLLGKNIRRGDQMIDAVDIFLGGRAGPNPKVGVKVLEDVPCDELVQVLERLVPYVSGKRATLYAEP